MIVSNQIAPTETQFKNLLAADLTGPINMVNLLKFRETAEYEDGRKTQLSGEEAFDIYAQQMAPHVESNGGRTVFTGHVGLLLVGEAEEVWDRVIVVEYPSKEAFFAIVSAPEVEKDYGLHRAAGLSGQLLLATSAAVH